MAGMDLPFVVMPTCVAHVDLKRIRAPLVGLNVMPVAMISLPPPLSPIHNSAVPPIVSVPV